MLTFYFKYLTSYFGDIRFMWSYSSTTKMTLKTLLQLEVVRKHLEAITNLTRKFTQVDVKWKLWY